jgi:hypothetical protein
MYLKQVEHTGFVQKRTALQKWKLPKTRFIQQTIALLNKILQNTQGKNVSLCVVSIV